MLRAFLMLLLAFAQVPQTGVISVNVRDSTTGQPIPGADITLNFSQTPPPNILTQATADVNGRFVFSDAAFGNYAVRAQRDGYIDTGVAITSNQRLTIDASNPAKTIELILERGATISGRVLDARGAPLAQAQVQLLRKVYRDGRQTLQRLPAPAETDDRGEYRLVGIAPGEYLVQSQLQPSRTAGQDKKARISYYPNTTDVKQAAPLRVTGPTDLAAIDINIPAMPVFTISGKVISAGEGGRVLPNGERQRTISSFFIGPRDASSMEEPVLVPNRSYAAAPNGLNETSFELPGFVPGSYYLYPLQSAELASFITRRTAVDVTDKDVDGLKIAIANGSDLQGKILIEGDAPTIRLQSLRPTIRWKESLPNLLTIRPPAAAPDPSTGEFTLKNVPEGRFTLTMNGLPPDAYISDVRYGPRNVYLDGIINTLEDSQGPIEVTVTTKGATVQGIARSANQEPVRNAGVVLVPAGTRRGNSLLYKRTTADAAGRFTMRGVAPGAYKLFAWPSLPEGAAEENAEFIAPFEARGVAVEVMAGGSATVDVGVIPQ